MTGKAQPWLARLNVRDSVVFGSTTIADDYAHGGGFLGEWDMGPETCKQCKDAACMSACPVGAIKPDPNTGARVVDTSVCVGCGSLRSGLPLGYAQGGSRDQEVYQVHHLRRLRQRLAPPALSSMIPWA